MHRVAADPRLLPSRCVRRPGEASWGGLGWTLVARRATLRWTIKGGDRNRTGDVHLGKLAMLRCGVMRREKYRGVARARCDGVAPRESHESRPVVTVLVTRPPHRDKQEA
jgi:hypothetical protein